MLLGWQIPVLLERTGELVGGVLLIALGAFSLWVAFSQQLYGHTHTHGDPLHTHWHLHLGPRSRHASGDHSHVPGILGAVFAVSGLRALTMMAPFGDAVTGGLAASLADAALPDCRLRGRHRDLDVAVRCRAFARVGLGVAGEARRAGRGGAHGPGVDWVGNLLDRRERIGLAGDAFRRRAVGAQHTLAAAARRPPARAAVQCFTIS